MARHLNTLAALISGIVGSKSSQLPSIATEVPDGAKPESRVKRFTRWLKNDGNKEEVYWPRSRDRPLYAFRGGRRGAGASSTESKIVANIERGFWPKKRCAAVVPSGRVRTKL